MKKFNFLTPILIAALLCHFCGHPANGAESDGSVPAEKAPTLAAVENKHDNAKRMVEFVDGHPVVPMHGSIMDSLGDDGVADAEGKNGSG